MRYVVLKDYINPDGEFVKMGKTIELPDDRFTSGLIQHDFITKAEIYDEFKDLATEVANVMRDVYRQVAEVLGAAKEEKE